MPNLENDEAREAVDQLAGHDAVAAYDLNTCEAALEERLAQEEVDLRDRLRIEPAALEEEFVRCSGDIAYVAGKHARAIHAHLVARVRAKRMHALLTVEHRQRLSAKNTKVTVGEVDAFVDMDPRWIEVKLEEDTAEALREDAKGKLMAVLAKKDMLVQMGANQRAEMERDPSIRNRMQGARAAKNEGDWG